MRFPVASRLPGQCYPQGPEWPIGVGLHAEFCLFRKLELLCSTRCIVQPRSSLQLVQYGRLHPLVDVGN